VGLTAPAKAKKQDRWRSGGKASEVLTEELAIWTVFGVAIVIVALLIGRGEPAPKIENQGHADRLDLH
jgi:hypothetical protein